jgi:putative acetyltransferase
MTVEAVEVKIHRDDLTSEQTQALVARHLAGMHENSPPDSVHAVNTDALRGMDVWSAWVGEQIAGVGALKVLDSSNAEIKSMRVADQFLRRGVARSLLRHLVEEAKHLGMTAVWLETGRGPAFVPAHRLYASEGFVVCGRFGDYQNNAFSVFMTKAL